VSGGTNEIDLTLVTLSLEVRAATVRGWYDMKGMEFIAGSGGDTPQLALVSESSFMASANEIAENLRADDDRRAKPACDADCICGIAGLCGFFKCTFGGGMLNFMCDACVGTGLACSLAALF
jgi:hypothetical protein